MDLSAEAEELKQHGNIQLEKGNFKEAIKLYSQAIDLQPSNHVYFANRSAAHIATNQWDKAKEDAEKSIELDANYIKGYYRLAKSQLKLGRKSEAIAVCKKALVKLPGNKDLEDLLEATHEAEGNAPEVEGVPITLLTDESVSLNEQKDDAISPAEEAVATLLEEEGEEKLVAEPPKPCEVQTFIGKAKANPTGPEDVHTEESTQRLPHTDPVFMREFRENLWVMFIQKVLNKADFPVQKDKRGSQAWVDYRSEPVPKFMIEMECLHPSRTKGMVQLLEKCYRDLMQVPQFGAVYASLDWRLCSPVPHFTQKRVGAKWSCGFRNIQMVCQSLMKRPEYRKVLFNGTTNGKVPSIHALQGWIYRAWHLGHDPLGAVFLSQIPEDDRWIGGCECASLLRSFGVRAKVVDFDPSFKVMLDRSKLKCPTARKRSVIEYAHPKEHGVKGMYTSMRVLFEGDECRRPQMDRLILDWVWKYLDPENHPSKNNARIYKDVNILPEHQWPEDYMPPLYFQHQGHSRSIIGMEKGVKKKLNEGEGMDFKEEPFSNLLIFDPDHIGSSVKQALQKREGWEQLLKRGQDTLTKDTYQIVYIQPGIMTSEEKENSKHIWGEGPFALLNPESDFVV